MPAQDQTRNWVNIPGVDAAMVNALKIADLITGPAVPIVKTVGTPNGTLTGSLGQLALDFATGTLYQNTDGASAWVVFIAGGGIVSGAYLGRQVITATGVYVPTAGTRAVLVVLVAGGGGGGGSTAPGPSHGLGGGSGVVWCKRIAPGAAVTGGAATIGAAGTGGIGGGAAATAGGDTSLVVNGTTYTAKGGPAGTISVQEWPTGAGGGSVAASTAGFDYAASWPGNGGGQNAAGTTACGSYGGATPYGAGGRPGQANAASTATAGIAPANGNGGGGGGSATSGPAGAAANGANGAAGLIIVDEFS